jgi:phosphate transport system protein
MMLLMTIQALEMNNEALALKVIAEDETVNKIYKSAITKIIDMIKEDTLEAEEAVYSLMLLKYLEKVGDHATNIAEWIIFTLTGIHKRTELY